jgi:thioredoxin reductase/ferredoxin
MDTIFTAATYTVAFSIAALIIWLYLRQIKLKSNETIQKIQHAKEFGFYEPVTLHPVIDEGMCIGSSACIEACPEKDILGIVGGKAKTINASRCVGHGACFEACPVQAITLMIGTAKRGVDLPHVNPDFESNIPLLFIAGELGGMGLIKNAVEQGKQAINALSKKLDHSVAADMDVAIIGAGPAGIAATLQAVSLNLTSMTFDQDTIGGTVYHFPRAKLILTAPMDIPLYGKARFKETTKTELLALWKEIIAKHKIRIHEMEKVLKVKKEDNKFTINTVKGSYTARAVVLAIGRRGVPRKLNVPGEEKEKVYYSLLDPELIHNQHILVVGGGDSAIESALLLQAEQNIVTLSYRGDAFSRLKPLNLKKISEAQDAGKIRVILNSEVKEINDNSVTLLADGSEQVIDNHLVYICIGGELPNEFLSDAGIKVSKKFGHSLLSHDN